LLEQWRAQWAAHVNRALEDAGASARVDHRSLAAQGIEREPQIHLGPSVMARAARGIDTDRGDAAQESPSTRRRSRSSTRRRRRRHQATTRWPLSGAAESSLCSGQRRGACGRKSAPPRSPHRHGE
jgi:hypothetical protein